MRKFNEIFGRFNVTDDKHYMKSFCKNYGLKNLISQLAFYKNQSNPACIDLILRNVLHSFWNTYVVEKGVFDFHLMTFSAMRKKFQRITA